MRSTISARFRVIAPDTGPAKCAADGSGDRTSAEPGYAGDAKW
ncbi:hypothetical protein [Mycobacterium sp. 1165178.9]|nr:hypothetical protein [Mycobacterium sp. 1165178.9]